MSAMSDEDLEEWEIDEFRKNIDGNIEVIQLVIQDHLEDIAYKKKRIKELQLKAEGGSSDQTD